MTFASDTTADNQSAITNASTPHFTYKRPSSKFLEQGDILSKTPEICEMLQTVHPHYLKDDYSHFIVLSQSCDLAWKKSRYITLAAVRPFDLALKRELIQHQDEIARIGGFCAVEKRDRLKDFLKKIFNNHSEYFYLHQDVGLNFPISSCAFLRLSIAVRVEDHTEKCLKARLFSIDDVFKAKLGWSVGNMYSRVGTDDWVPAVESETDFNKRAKDILDASCMWAEEKKLKQLKKKVEEGSVAKESSALKETLKTLKIRSRKDELVERVLVLLSTAEIIDSEKSKIVQKLLTNDQLISELLK